MPTTQTREGIYFHPLSVVSAALWDKYENHEWIKDHMQTLMSNDEDGLDSESLHNRTLCPTIHAIYLVVSYL